MTTSSTNRKDVQDSATEDEDSDPQLPDQLRPSKRSSPKGPASARPATRSRQSDVPPKPISSRSDEAEDPDPETFIRPHPTTSARTRPTPARDPSTSRTNQRDIKKSVRGDIPKRVSAQNMFPTVVKSNQGRPSGDTEKSSTESTKLAGHNNVSGIRHAEAEDRQPEPPLPAGSGLDPSPTKSVSFRADEASGQDEFGPGDDGERVMSSVDLEKAKVLSQQASSNPTRFVGCANCSLRLPLVPLSLETMLAPRHIRGLALNPSLNLKAIRPREPSY
ncbi:hypothetical protein FRC12_023529 [Ceratobasidium sp. 428]|nr:hypothetical protein FRC12_023529 [Ceratobasidium sp. 428]